MDDLDQWFSARGMLAAQSAHNFGPSEVLRTIQIVLNAAHITDCGLHMWSMMINRLRTTGLDVTNPASWQGA